MDSFKKSLLQKYGKTIKELSSTNESNVLMNRDDVLISLDNMASDLSLKIKEFKGNKLSSADALWIFENEGEFIFHIIEFKNLDFNINKDRLMSKFYLKKLIKHINNCEYNCPFASYELDVYENLVDKYNVSIRTKPVESLTLIYYYLCNYLDDSESAKEKLFNAKKYYWFISKTESGANSPFHTNKSNNHRRNSKHFRYLDKIKHYFYDDTYGVSNILFNKYLNRHFKP